VPSIDLLASSRLRRAVDTAQIIADTYAGISRIERDELAPGADLEGLIHWLAAENVKHTLCIVGHEPDLSELLASLRPSANQAFLGAYGTKPIGGPLKTTVDPYYLGFRSGRKPASGVHGCVRPLLFRRERAFTWEKSITGESTTGRQVVRGGRDHFGAGRVSIMLAPSVLPDVLEPKLRLVICGIAVGDLCVFERSRRGSNLQPSAPEADALSN
jgi:hypothetical protein